MDEKYISASKLKAHYSWLGKGATLSPKDVDDIIDAQPAADVEPVVRGEWKATYISGLKVSDGAVCSKCDCWSARRSSFCPNCGAPMERSGSGE